MKRILALLALSIAPLSATTAITYGPYHLDGKAIEFDGQGYAISDKNGKSLLEKDQVDCKVSSLSIAALLEFIKDGGYLSITEKNEKPFIKAHSRECKKCKNSEKVIPIAMTAVIANCAAVIAILSSNMKIENAIPAVIGSSCLIGMTSLILLYNEKK